MRDLNKIRNYTTSVPASKTFIEIEEMLAGLGADAIMKNLRGDGKVDGLAFKYKGHGYRLPAELEKVAEVLKDTDGYRNRTGDGFDEQVYRVAWRVIHDWLDAQISLIRIGQAEVDQVMLPYMWDGKETLYDKVKRGAIALPKAEG